MKKLVLAVSLFALAGVAAAVQRPGSTPKPAPATATPAAAPAAPAKAGGLPGARPATAAPAEPAPPPNVVGGPSSPVTFETPTVEFEKRKNVLVAKLGVKVSFNVESANASITVKSKCTLNGKVVKETTVLKAGKVVPGVDSVLTTELKGMVEKTKQCELEFGYGASAKFERLAQFCWPGGESERGIYDGPCE